jgi:hypothetical protein
MTWFNYRRTSSANCDKNLIRIYELIPCGRNECRKLCKYWLLFLYNFYGFQKMEIFKLLLSLSVSFRCWKFMKRRKNFVRRTIQLPACFETNWLLITFSTMFNRSLSTENKVLFTLPLVVSFSHSLSSMRKFNPPQF